MLAELVTYFASKGLAIEFGCFRFEEDYAAPTEATPPAPFLI
jgi:hypothetical protein